MHLSRVDRAFERYRASGDPRPLARVFDATAPELFRLAWHLIGDRHAAEDLVQTTFLVAIENARLFEPGNRVMPWLCGILANRARDARRRARVRSAVTAPVEAAVANPADAASGNELTSAVRERVRALSEPYRTVLILHLEHLLSGKEIADALHRPAATVRSQIHRGLEMLRKALPMGFTAGLSSPTPPKSLDRVRAVVLAKASAAAPKSVGPLVGSTGGVLAVKKLVGIAIVLVLALVVAQLWMDGWDYESPNVPSPVSPTMAQVPEPEAVSTNRFDPPERRPLADATPVDETGAIVVSVHWADNGAPAPDVAVRWWPKHGLAELFERMGRTDSDGHVRFGDLAPGPCVVAVDRGDRAAAEVSAGATHRIEIAILPGLELRGRVLDGEDRPIARASVWLSNDSGSVDRGDIVAETGVDGSFVVRAVQPGRMVSAWAEGFQPARVIKIPDGEEGQPFEVTLRLHAAPGTLHGRVVQPDGEPVENAIVLVGQADGARYIIADGKPMADPARFVRSDGSGWFHVTGVRPGRQLVWARAPGFAPWRETIEVAGYGTTSFEIRLLRGATVSGKIVDRDGDPAEMVWVRALHEEIEPGALQAWQGPDWARVWTMTDSEGRFELSHLMPGRMKLRAQRDRDHVTADFSLLDEEHETWEAQIGSGLSIRGVVSDENAVPLSDWKVWAQPTQGQKGLPMLQTVRTDEGGRFALTGAEAGSYDLIVRFDESGMHPAEWTVYSVPPGPEIVQVAVPSGRIPSTRFAGSILSPDGEPLGDFRLSLIRIGEDGTLEGAGGAERIEEGRFTSKRVLPGLYFVTVRAEEHGTLRLGTWEGGASETVDIGEHGYSEPGELGVEIVGSDGERIPHGGIVLRREGQPQGTLMSMDHGEYGVAHLSALPRQTRAAQTSAAALLRTRPRTLTTRSLAPEASLDRQMSDLGRSPGVPGVGDQESMVGHPDAMRARDGATGQARDSLPGQSAHFPKQADPGKLRAAPRLAPLHHHPIAAARDILVERPFQRELPADGEAHAVAIGELGFATHPGLDVDGRRTDQVHQGVLRRPRGDACLDEVREFMAFCRVARTEGRTIGCGCEMLGTGGGTGFGFHPSPAQPDGTGTREIGRRAAEGMFGRRARQASPYRIRIDVPNERSSVSGRPHRSGEVATSDERAVSLPPSVESSGVVVLDPAHGFRESSDRAAHEQVEVRRHQAVGVDLDASQPNLPHEAREEEARIGQVFKEGSLGDPPVHHMVPASRLVCSG